MVEIYLRIYVDKGSFFHLAAILHYQFTMEALWGQSSTPNGLFVTLASGLEFTGTFVDFVCSGLRVRIVTRLRNLIYPTMLCVLLPLLLFFSF